MTDANPSNCQSCDTSKPCAFKSHTFSEHDSRSGQYPGRHSCDCSTGPIHGCQIQFAEKWGQRLLEGALQGRWSEEGARDGFL